MAIRIMEPMIMPAITGHLERIFVSQDSEKKSKGSAPLLSDTTYLQ
jgi:hypothetical protein